MKPQKLGVVLSGGGAKGAYEAGFLKYLAEIDVQPQAIAGTSIGALNGALFSASKETKNAAELLLKLWEELASVDVLTVDKEKAMKNIIEVLVFFAPMPLSKLTKLAIIALKAGKSNEGVLTTLPIVDRLKKYASENDLERGLPFYVGVSESEGNAKDFINFLEFGSQKTTFMKIQDLPVADMHKAIIASAALPILFDGVEIDGKIWRDGCLGSTDDYSGVTPARPLIESEGCTHLIVCHLEEGSFFNRHDPLFKNVPIIEVRPEAGTFSSAFDALQFKPEKITDWIEQGYKDSKRIIGDSLSTLKIIEERKSAEQQASSSIDRLKNQEFNL